MKQESTVVFTITPGSLQPRKTVDESFIGAELVQQTADRAESWLCSIEHNAMATGTCTDEMYSDAAKLLNVIAQVRLAKLIGGVQ